MQRIVAARFRRAPNAHLYLHTEQYLDTMRYVPVEPTTATRTFLFMDLVGFTALTAEQGDSNAADIAHSFYGEVRDLLASHDAEEIKTIGDAMMLRCEDPREGIDLGIALVERVRRSTESPPIRVAVHTGTAVYRAGDWYGNAVNVAARLCSVAGGGEVLISDDARTAARSLDGLELGERQLHWLKNVPEPVVTWSASSEARSPFDRVRLRLAPRLRLQPPRCIRPSRVPA